MPAVLAGCSWKDPNPPVWRREKAPFSLNFSYVCPEPVLVKPSFLYQDGPQTGRFCHLPHFLIFFRNDRLPRQARDEHRESCQQSVFLQGATANPGAKPCKNMGMEYHGVQQVPTEWSDWYDLVKALTQVRWTDTHSSPLLL
jgi:hypothetical protein